MLMRPPAKTTWALYAGPLLLLGVLLAAVLVVRYARRDGAANRQRSYERRWARDGVLRAFDARLREEATEEPEGTPVEALPSRLSAEDLRALSPEDRARLLARVGGRTKRGG
jgi:hypothetical protein